MAAGRRRRREGSDMFEGFTHVTDEALDDSSKS